MKKEGEIMARTMSRINNLDMSSYQRKQIGLSDNWKENISPAQRKMVAKIAAKFKETLRELSKN